MERSTSDFSHFTIAPGSVCWQIDNDRLEPPLDDGNWESELALALIDLAEEHESSELVCSTTCGASVDFGHTGFSVWIACAGSPPMIRACADLIKEIVPSHCLRRDIVSSSQDWVKRIQMADGHVWQPADAATWENLVEKPNEEPRASDDVGVEDDGYVDDEDWSVLDEVTAAEAKKKKRRNVAQGGVKISYYQRKVEKMLGLPEGSVKFVNRDGTVSKSNQLIRNLRARWEE